jgi:hypothetical protein
MGLRPDRRINFFNLPNSSGCTKPCGLLIGFGKLKFQ